MSRNIDVIHRLTSFYCNKVNIIIDVVVVAILAEISLKSIINNNVK